jgi:hypothetical protein
VILKELEKYSNVKFNANLSSGSHVVSCGWTNMTRLIVTLRNFVNAPENGNIFGVTSRNEFSYERR